MPSPEDHAVVESLVSVGRFRPYLVGRFRPYLDVCGGDIGQAVELYQWSVRLTGACFEAIHYVEVVIRNSVDREMRQHGREEQRGIPWFLLPVEGKGATRFEDNVSEVRKRLRRQGTERETRDQIIAGLDLGFWSELFHSGYDELWKRALHKVFPHSSGKRADVVAALEALRPATGSPTTTPCCRWTSPSG